MKGSKQCKISIPISLCAINYFEKIIPNLEQSDLNDLEQELMQSAVFDPHMEEKLYMVQKEKKTRNGFSKKDLMFFRKTRPQISLKKYLCN